MSGLPSGWVETSLGEVALSVKNGIFVSRPGSEPNGVPILRISAVRPGTLQLGDVRYSGMSAEQLARSGSLLRPGDLLFTRYNGNIDYVGACALVPEGARALTYPDKLIRVEVDQRVVDPRYVRYAFEAPQIRALIRSAARTTAGQAGISGSDLRAVRFPVPPLAQQRRIIAILDEYFTRTDEGLSLARAVQRRVALLRKRVLVEAVPAIGPPHWLTVKTGEAGMVDLGRQRHPDWHVGQHMRPYLRVANVFEDRIDLTDVMEMDFSPIIFEKFRLRKGDILLNEGQSPEYLGRPALYQGVPEEIAFTNSLLRFRARPGVDPEWALLVFRRHMHAGRFVQEVRITTNIAHLSAMRFKEVEFPIPPIEEQRTIVAKTNERLDAVARLASASEVILAKAARLRAALLSAALAGRLVPEDPSDEPASELLARIRSERAALPPKQRAARARRTPKDKPAPQTRVIGRDYQQGELPL